MKYHPDDIYNYVKEVVTKYPGVFPTIREVAARFEMGSTSLARQRLKMLVEDGRLKEYEPGRYYVPGLHVINGSVTVEKLPPNQDHNRQAIQERFRQMKEELLAA